jgi:glycosyltransferase involved in cell wall biosynthesis
VEPGKIRFYHRGIDIERFTPAKRNGFFKRKFGYDDKRLKLIYVGRISREKNLPLLADIFGKIHARRRDLTLVVVGDGPYLAEMKREMEGLPVLFTGVLTGDDLAEAFASSDIFVFPSTTDTFGNVVLEAQASGLPVVLTDRGGPKENMIAEKTGFVVPADQPERFVEILTDLAEHPTLIRKMGSEARNYMKDRGFEGAFLKLWEDYSETAASCSSN